MAASPQAVLNAKYGAALRRLTQHGELARYVTALRNATHPRLKYPLSIRGYNTEGNLVLLPTNPARYQNARFSVNGERDETAGPTFHEGMYGYDLPEEFRRIGPFDYIQLNASGDVVEASFRSADGVDDFQHHLRGRALNKRSAARMVQVQEMVFALLRSNTACKAELAAFARSREWPVAWPTKHSSHTTTRDTSTSRHGRRPRI